MTSSQFANKQNKSKKLKTENAAHFKLFRPHTAATICLSVLEALRTIHGVGIIHQLLKPGHLAIRLEVRKSNE